MGRRVTGAADPTLLVGNRSSPTGRSRLFDIVILAVGFGLELDLGKASSYWRNETLAQPHLDQAVHTFLVSGTGDGAMIDLFRLRISHFRQDRILAELFKGRQDLLLHLNRLCRIESAPDPPRLFNRFQEMESDATYGPEVQSVIRGLTNRLRTDTHANIHTRHRQFADVFDSGKVSFQNRLLAFLLFRAGGFYPSADKIKDIVRENNVLPTRIIRRHGTNQASIPKSILDVRLRRGIKEFKSERVSIRRMSNYGRAAILRDQFTIPPI